MQQRIVDVLGNFLIAVAIGMVGAFILFSVFVKDPLPLHPVEAYCRGAVDGRTSVIREVQVYNPSPEQLDELEAGCRDDPDAIRGRGPLLPEDE